MLNAGLILVLLLAFLASPLMGRAQQDSTQSSPPHKVFTPEQLERQRAWKEYESRRLSLQAQGKQALAEESAREKAGDCPRANSEYDFNVCFGDRLTATNENLKSLEGVIQALQAPAQGTLVEPANSTPGIAGPVLSPKQLSAEFDHVEEVWRQYRETACSAAFHQFSGGTGGPSFELQCELKLTRDHMRELNLIYGMDLHL